jgi:hypothetical protein
LEDGLIIAVWTVDLVDEVGTSNAFDNSEADCTETGLLG